jgi:hypothetical protein
MLSPPAIADQPASTARLFARLKLKGMYLLYSTAVLIVALPCNVSVFVGTVQPPSGGLSAVRPWYPDFLAVKAGLVPDKLQTGY